MTTFHYHHQEAYSEAVALKDVAKEFGTPCYIYSRKMLENNWHTLNNMLTQKLKDTHGHCICYAVKANPNLTLLNLLSRLGSGFDIVSIGELERVLSAGGDPKKIVFSGVGKQAVEIERALQVKIHCFNVESESELECIQYIAQKQGTKAPIALRVNPNINPLTHPYIATGLKNNKFGIALETLPALLMKIKKMPNIQLIGIACHVGSQLVKIEPFIEVMECLRKLYIKLSQEGFSIQHIDIGGGLGVCYHEEAPPSLEAYTSSIKEIFSSCPVNIILEPGRSLIANAGILLTRIEYIKSTPDKNFAIVDAGMNDLLRPALYQAWQDIAPVFLRDTTEKMYDIVGPVCESSDFLGHDRRLKIEPGDLLAVLMAGAYGFSMSSNYNSRPRAAEVLVDKNNATLIRRRETLKELLQCEQSLNGIFAL